jgi:hypothetical protein
MALSHSPNIVTNGLVLYLDAANPRSYPRSGTTWFDISSKNNNSSLTNGPTYDSLNGGSILLDGANDYITAPSVNTLGELSNQAYEIWVKSSGLGVGKTLGGLICPDYGMISYISNNGNIYYSAYSTDGGYPGTYLVSALTTGINLFDNKWHHIVCTRNSSTYNIYLDGTSVKTGNGGGTWSGTTIWSSMSTQIGNNPNDAYYNLNGNIAIAKIYRKFLTQSEVVQNFNATRGRFGV